MRMQFFVPGTEEFNILQEALEPYIDLPHIAGRKFRIPNESVVLALFNTDDPKEIALSRMVGATVIYNWDQEIGTIAISPVELMPEQIRLWTRQYTHNLYDWIFEHKKVDTVYAYVSSSSKPTLAGLRKFGYDETLLPHKRGEDHEHILWFRKNQWDSMKKDFSGATKLKKDRIIYLSTQIYDNLPEKDATRILGEKTVDLIKQARFKGE